uniref:Autophagy-related protein 13 n=1 Tax=Trichuris muris TaxID=70415 RepID=A0A5S6QS28_TRIMR
MRRVSRETDWFNLSVNESPEVTQVLKESLGDRCMPELHSVVLVISLRTTDGESLDLEIWKLSLDDQVIDPSVSVRSHLYHRMSVMLRSVLCASRSTPVYRQYAGRQAPDSFVLCYQICTDPPPIEQLGDEAKNCPLGCLSSPFGTLHLTLQFRTKMVINNGKFQDTSVPVRRGIQGKMTTDLSTATDITGCDDPFGESDASRQLDSWYPLAEPVFTSNIDNFPAACRLSYGGSSAPQVTPFLSRVPDSAAVSTDSQHSFDSSSYPTDILSDSLPPVESEFPTLAPSSSMTVGISQQANDPLFPAESCSEPALRDDEVKYAATVNVLPTKPEKMVVPCGVASPELLSSWSPKAGKFGSPCREDVKLAPIGECSESDLSAGEDSSSDSISSTGSFVHVDRRQVFAAGSSTSDLGAFYREFRTAPACLDSFAGGRPFELGCHPRGSSSGASNGESIEAQLNRFSQLQGAFDTFLESLKADEEEEM